MRFRVRSFVRPFVRLLARSFRFRLYGYLFWGYLTANRLVATRALHVYTYGPRGDPPTILSEKFDLVRSFGLPHCHAWSLARQGRITHSATLFLSSSFAAKFGRDSGLPHAAGARAKDSICVQTPVMEIEWALRVRA